MCVVSRVYRNVKVEEENYNRLIRIKGYLEQRFGRAFSLNDVIETLLDLYDERGGEFFAAPMEELGLYFVERKGRRIGGRGGRTKRG